MGLEELVGRLERDAEARVAAIEAGARAEVEAITAAADQARGRARDERLADLRALRRARLGREIAEARQAARAERLRAEHALLERVLARARVLLEAAHRDERYLSAVPARLVEALGFVEGGPVRVRCRPDLGPTAHRAIGERAEATVEEVAGMPAGFTLLAGDGSVEVDDTLSSRLERLRPRLLVELLAEVDR